VRGYRSFVNQCAFCHNGEGVGGARLRLLGDEEPWPHRDDLGVAELTGDPADELVFRVPSLRYVASTPPYFHDGSVETLDEAVKLMGKHQLGVAFTDPEIAELVAFLEALDAAPEARWREAP
jgi:cytochrome c peroxidase